MSKENVVQPFNGTLSGHKRDWNTNTNYNIDVPWKHYANWKKTKRSHIYDSVI